MVGPGTHKMSTAVSRHRPSDVRYSPEPTAEERSLSVMRHATMHPMKTHWHVYVLQCADGSLYTGITTDIERRVSEHNEGAKGARYTRARRPVRLRESWMLPDRSTASRAEAAFKRLSRADKIAVMEGRQSAPWISPDAP